MPVRIESTVISNTTKTTTVLMAYLVSFNKQPPFHIGRLHLKARNVVLVLDLGLNHENSFIILFC